LDWQHQVKEAFQTAGWAAKVELFDADVYINTGQIEIVVEIAMENTERKLDHIKQHQETGYDVIWVVCPNEEVREGLQQRTEAAGCNSEHLIFQLVHEIGARIDRLTDE